jgi:SAM-dependent methyltransferase
VRVTRLIAARTRNTPEPSERWVHLSRFISSAFRSSSLRECYEQTAAFYEKIFGENQVFYSRMIVALLDQRYGRNFHNALDLGAGTGILTRKLRLVSGVVCGVDFSAAMLEQAVLENPRAGGASYVAGNVLALPLPDRQFDLVTALGLMTHILPKDFERFVREIDRVAADSAVVIIAMPPLPWRLFFARRPSFQPTAIDKALSISYNLLQAALRLDERRGVYVPAVFSEAFAKHGFLVEHLIVENLSLILASR